MRRTHGQSGVLMSRDDSILEKIEQDLSNQEDLINEQEKLLALLRTAGLPTAEA